ncbi:MAG: DUF262 domain-containing protein [Ignavibacteria bacterium]|nr:DUF262 domain-containing protein [Ignavibacteria bacterium]MBK6420396.1 DUF262 domain-containing protein [Ignavibacteria bacterium]
MKATEINLNRFLSQTDTQFVIPVYQRNYDWTEAQCKQLHNDIIAAGASEKVTAHFIGSIVYIHDDVYSASGIRELSIIDGQQRLTTITLIYIALYRLLKSMGDQQKLTRIHETYLINKFAAEEEKLKLRPTENNDRALKHLLAGDDGDSFDGGFSRVISNSRFFSSHINEDNIEHVLIGLSKLMFVEVSLERDKDDAQRIFESLNSTGLELSQADLIRNFILMGLTRKRQDDIYLKYWQKIELNAKELRTNQSRVSDFIRDYLTLKTKKIPNKSSVYAQFKERFPVLQYDDLETLLEELKILSRHYQKFINPDLENDKDIRRSLHDVEHLEINVSYPFLLQVFSDYENKLINKTQLLGVMDLIQSFVWRRFIIGLPTNALNKIFMRLYEDVDSGDYVDSIARSLMKKKGPQRFPRNAEVIATVIEKDFYNIKSKSRTYFLQRLENYKNKETVQLDGNSDITVEHIFPQTPDVKWKLDLDAASFQAFVEIHLHSIGNLTLSGNNGSLGNKCFAEKKLMNQDAKEQGYAFSRLWLNRYLKDIDTWNLETYKERSRLLSERVLDIWRYPEIEISDSATNEEVSIFEAEDPTGRKLEFVVFADERHAVTTISDLYILIMRELYIRNPEPFFASTLRDRLRLSKDASDCRNAIELNEGYYIEGNLSSIAKFERIQEALTLYDAEDDLTICYAN